MASVVILYINIHYIRKNVVNVHYKLVISSPSFWLVILKLDILCRFKKILSSSTKLCLYNSFTMSYFTYCSTVWHNCLKSDSQKLDKLNERALRYIYSGQSPTNARELGGRTGYTLADLSCNVCQPKPQLIERSQSF